MKPTLALFLELGGSFEQWNKVGFFQREIVLYNLLAKRFFKTVYVFTYGDEGDLRYQDAFEKNVVIIPRKKRSGSYLANFFYETVLSFRHRHILKRCDIFRTNQNSGALAAAIAKVIRPESKLVVRSGYVGSELAQRSNLPFHVKLYYFFVERVSYRLCDQAFIPTQENYGILMGKYPFLKNKLAILNNFIDTDRFAPYPNPEKKYDVIYVGRMNRDKNHRALLKAVKGQNLDILFIGNGEGLEPVKSLAKELNVRATFIESVPNNDLPAYYNASRVCAFPSLHEGNPKALLEAMSCGLAIAALPVPGVKNIIDHELNGLLGPEEDLRDNILRLLSDTLLRDRLGSEARKTVLEGFSLGKILEMEIRTYRKLIRKEVCARNNS
jgi:glycosyltransferase involved in cell wall biosynthesis